jgi:hypothetical protein
MTDHLAGRNGSGNPRPRGLGVFAENPEEYIEAARARTGRSCGDCSLCCKVLDITEPELKKPAGEWCKHCTTGVGCSIYKERPQVCRGFGCEWLVDDLNLDEAWKPSRSKIVVHKTAVRNVGTALSESFEIVCKFVVDPAAPNRWREEPYYSTIKAAARAGLMAPEGYGFTTHVTVGRRYWTILPDADIELTDCPAHTTVQVGPASWEVLKFSSVAKARGFLQLLSMRG